MPSLDSIIVTPFVRRRGRFIPPPLCVSGWLFAGKEVALFVQEHMAEELIKLQEYRGGDFPGALIR